MSGAVVELKIDHPGYEALLARFRKLTDAQADELLETIGSEIESQTRRRISEERKGPEGELWEPTLKTKKPGKSLLQEEGHLVDSLQSFVGVTSVETGSNLVYAAIHQFGFNGPQKVREHTRKGRPVRAHTRHMVMPARPYLGMNAANEKDIASTVNDFFTALAEGR